MRKRASYVVAIRWIATEDDPTEVDLETVASTLTVCLVADLWGYTPHDVARAVVRFRLAGEVQS